MSLIVEFASAFKTHIFDPLHAKGGWRILVLDDVATRLLSCCFRMQDITAQGITLVESLKRKRQCLNMEAVYILLPRRGEVELLLRDFSSSSPTYPAAHVFFLMSCSNDLLSQIASSPGIRFFKTLVQLELNFHPLESHLYTLDASETAILNFLPPDMDRDKLNRMDYLAEQLASVCVILQEYPKICYQKTDNNLELARLVQLKLDACRADNPNMGLGSHKDQSVLLIVERGLDPLSPLLHELTLQAMCYDLLKIEDNTFEYGNNKKANVADQDPLWKELRHQHIADVTRTLPKRVRAFAESKKQFMNFEEASSKLLSPQSPESSDGGFVNEAVVETGSSKTSKDAVGLRDLSNLLKRMPQFQTEAASYSAAYHIAETCMSIFQKGVDKLCDLEQDLVMGQNAQGDVITDPMRALAEIFKYDFSSVEERLRILMIFVLTKDGINESHLDKLLDCAQVARTLKPLFASLSLVTGAQLIQPDPVNLNLPAQASGQSLQFGRYTCLKRLPPISTVADVLQSYLPVKKKRQDRVDTNSYALSRWTPYLLDIMEQTIEGKLDKGRFVFLVSKGTKDVYGLGTALNTGTKFKGPSARFHGGSGGSNLGLPNTGLPSARSPSPTGAGWDRSTTNSMSDHCGPRLIVCVVGGVTLSEARSAYQLTQKCLETRLAASDRSNRPAKPATSSNNKPPTLTGGGGIGWNWEVIVGGTHLLTPKTFLDDLESISKLIVSPSATELATRRTSIFPSLHRT